MPAAFSVARTRAGVIGASRMRTPVASKNAFATAATVVAIGISPEPVDISSSRWTTIGVTQRRLTSGARAIAFRGTPFRRRKEPR